MIYVTPRNFGQLFFFHEAIFFCYSYTNLGRSRLPDFSVIFSQPDFFTSSASIGRQAASGRLAFSTGIALIGNGV
jgi:hypothetical protein